MKPEERNFFIMAARLRGPRAGKPFIDELAREHGIPEKRALFWVQKWIGKHWFDCGVSERSGWFTETGIAAAEEMARAVTTGEG